MSSEKMFEIAMPGPEETDVKINVFSEIDCRESRFVLKIECRQQFAAQLLATELNRQFRKGLADIRKAAYLAGWKDAKGKKLPKKTEFFSVWDSSRVGW
jgi:hypothetical protein